jgi:hypothetical protein
VHCVFSVVVIFSQKNHYVQNRFSAVLFSECGKNEETILKRQRTHNRFVCLNASPASGQKNSPPTVYCLNCDCQRNKQMLLGNDCCSTHTVGTSQKKRKQLFHIHQIPWRTPRPNATASPFRPPLAKKNMNRVFYTYAAALLVHLEIKCQTNSATLHSVVANSRSSVSTR